MNCCMAELTKKEVINAKTGARLGCVNDIEVDTCSGRVSCLIVWTDFRCMGLLGHKGDFKIPWDCVQVVGDDTVIVCVDSVPPTACSTKPKGKILDSLFR